MVCAVYVEKLLEADLSLEYWSSLGSLETKAKLYHNREKNCSVCEKRSAYLIRSCWPDYTVYLFLADSCLLRAQDRFNAESEVKWNGKTLQGRKNKAQAELCEDSMFPCFLTPVIHFFLFLSHSLSFLFLSFSSFSFGILNTRAHTHSLYFNCNIFWWHICFAHNIAKVNRKRC